MRNSKKGFTTVELVIVIAVIAILAAVIIPTFVSLISKANDSAALTELRQIQTLIETELADDNSWEFTDDQGVTIEINRKENGMLWVKSAASVAAALNSCPALDGYGSFEQKNSDLIYTTKNGSGTAVWSNIAEHYIAKYATYDDYLKTIDSHYYSDFHWSSSSLAPHKRLADKDKLSLSIPFDSVSKEEFGSVVFINPDTNKEYSSEECKPVRIDEVTHNITGETLKVIIPSMYTDTYNPNGLENFFEYDCRTRRVNDGNDNITVNLYLKVGDLTDVAIRVLDKEGNTIDEQYMNIDALLDYWLRQEIITDDELPDDWTYDKNWSYGGYYPS